jgi:hypothetical protein
MATVAPTPPPSPGCGLSKTRKMVIAAGEVKGRRIKVFQPRPCDRDFVDGMVMEYSEITNMHLVAFTGKGGEGQFEVWLYLGEQRFCWPEDAPRDAPSNPSFKPMFSKESCIGTGPVPGLCGPSTCIGGTVCCQWCGVAPHICSALPLHPPAQGGSHVKAYRPCSSPHDY